MTTLSHLARVRELKRLLKERIIMKQYWELLETRDELNMKIEELSMNDYFLENHKEVLSLLNDYKNSLESEIYQIDSDD